MADLTENIINPSIEEHKKSVAALWSDTKEAMIAERGIHRHRAGEDARLLQLTYQHTRQLTERMGR